MLIAEQPQSKFVSYLCQATAAFSFIVGGSFVLGGILPLLYGSPYIALTGLLLIGDSISLVVLRNHPWKYFVITRVVGGAAATLWYLASSDVSRAAILDGAIIIPIAIVANIMLLSTFIYFRTRKH